MRNKKLLILVVFCLSLFAINSLFAQTKRKDTRPLIFKLSTPIKKLCLGAKEIELKLEIVNVSKSPLTIDKNFLWDGSVSGDFIRNGNVESSWTGLPDYTYPYSGNYHKIDPGQKYSESYSYSFLDSDRQLNKNFDKTGLYTLLIRYHPFNFGQEELEVRKDLYKGESIFSNKIKFHIVDCPSSTK